MRGWTRKAQVEHSFYLFLIFVSQDARIPTKIVPIKYVRAQNALRKRARKALTCLSSTPAELFCSLVIEKIRQTSKH